MHMVAREKIGPILLTINYDKFCHDYSSIYPVPIELPGTPDSD